MEFKKIFKRVYRMSKLSNDEQLKIVSESEGNDTGGLGNKQPNPINQCKFQCKSWVMTWNNYPTDWCEQMSKNIVPLCERWVFGEEIGKQGTPHIQGAFILKSKMRQGTLCKLLNANVWMDKMKGKWENQVYCMKDGKYVCDEKSRDFACAKSFRKPMKILDVDELNAWELKIYNIVKHEEPDDRTINWFYSKRGNMGKTTFCKFLTKTFGGCVIGGKSADSKNNIATYVNNAEDKRAPELVICPIPKSYDVEYISYEAIEMIKDMYFYSGKYEGGQVNDDCPHVFVFANNKPDISKMMKDRWKVYEILDKEGNYVEKDVNADDWEWE